MTEARRLGVCFVCLGNICRSPTAEGIFRGLVDESGQGARFLVDSAGTGAWHEGDPPDERSVTAARQRGVVLEGAARQFQPQDFARFDHVVAMDAENHANLCELAPDREARAKISMLRDHEPPASGADVPDPYYGGEGGFDDVFEICEIACRGLFERVGRERVGRS